MVPSPSEFDAEVDVENHIGKEGQAWTVVAVEVENDVEVHVRSPETDDEKLRDSNPEKGQHGYQIKHKNEN